MGVSTSSALQIVQTGPGQSVNWNSTINSNTGTSVLWAFDQFDSSQGILDSVTVTVQLTGEGDWMLDFPSDKLDVTGDMNGGVYYNLQFSNGQWSVSGVAADNDVQVFPASGGWFMSQGVTSPDYDGFSFNLNETIGLSTQPFISNGPRRESMGIDNWLFFKNSFTQDGQPFFGVSDKWTEFNWKQSVTLTYNYHVPEPSGLSALGLAGIGGILRRRRQAV
jgi:hypothetical protein